MCSARPTPEISVTVCEDWGRLPVTPEQWNALVRSGGTNTVFQTFEWNDAWLAAYGKRWQPLTIVARRGEDVVAIAPMVLDRSSVVAPRAAIQGCGNADYQDFIGGPDQCTIALLLRALASRVSGVVVELSNIPTASATDRMVGAAASSAGLRALRRSEIACPTLLLSDAGRTGQALLRKYSLRRPHNYFSRRGELSARRLTSCDDALEHLPRFFDQHVRRWARTRTPSRFKDDRMRDFFRELAKRLSRTGWLDFSVISLDAKPLAYHFGFCYGGTLTWYKPSFEIGEARHSPGLLLIRHLVQRGLDDGFAEIDFTIGPEPFKSRFTNHVRTNATWRLYATWPAFASGRIACAARRTLALLRRR